MNNPIIVVSGIIGAGKTTLTQQLSKQLGYEPFFECVETNPYLEDFYKNKKRHAFAMQMFLLTKRFRAYQNVLWGDKPAILDRSLFEDVLFAECLREEGAIDPRDWETYINHFDVMKSFIRYPDVIVYLRVTPELAMERVSLRARDAEKTMDLQYLKRLFEGYEEFVDDMQRYTTVLTLDWSTYQPATVVARNVQAALDTNQHFLRSLRRI